MARRGQPGRWAFEDFDDDDWIPFRDPRRAEKSWNKGGKLRLVWPKDKPHMGKLDRFKDCITNKGPDMFIATGCGDEDPHRPIWSGWVTRDHDPTKREWDNFGYDFRQDNEFVSWDKACRRRESKREAYDFRTRKYVRPKGREWSDVVWDPEHPKHALYTRNAYGSPLVDPLYDCNGFNQGFGPNPFRAGEVFDLRFKRRHWRDGRMRNIKFED